MKSNDVLFIGMRVVPVSLKRTKCGTASPKRLTVNAQKSDITIQKLAKEFAIGAV